MSYRLLHYTYSSFFLLLFLSGCISTHPTAEKSVIWQQHQTQLEQLTHYQINGKLGYKTPDQSHSLNFRWTQKSDDESQLLLTTFLGQTVLKLSITELQTTIVDGDGQTYISHDPGRLIYGLTGMNIPVGYLKDWMKGLPTSANTIEFNQFNTVGQLSKTIDEARWDLTYNHYIEKNGLMLPASMKLTQQETLIKIEISTWTLS